MARIAVFKKFRLVALAAALLLMIGLVSACGEPSGGATGQPTPTPTVITTVQPTSTPTSVATAQPTATPDGQNVLYLIYFHRAQRCSGCIRMQDMTEYTLNTYFADELESGEIVFMALNLQDTNNSAMVQKFGAYTSSLFLNDVAGGADDIEELTDVWFVLWDDEELVNTVKTAIEECLAD